MDTYRILILFIFNLIFLLYGDTPEVFRDNYNHIALEKLIKNKVWTDYEEEKDWYYWTFSIIKEKNKPYKNVEEYAFRVIDVLDRGFTNGEGSSKDYFRLAYIYDSLIVDATTGMKYSGIQQKYLKKSLELDPDNIDSLILETRNLIFNPTRAGGNLDMGLQKLEELHRINTENIDILLIYGEYNLQNEYFSIAKEYFKKILDQKANHLYALRNYNQLLLLERNLPIRSINIRSKLKTKISKQEKELKHYISKIYDIDTIEKIKQTLLALPSITEVYIEPEESKDEVNLFIDIKENNMQAYIFLGSVTATKTNKDYPELFGFPAILYMNQNILGSGNILTVMFAGVFLSIDYTFPEKNRYPLDLILHADSMYIPTPLEYIEEGDKLDWGITTPVYNVNITLKTTTPFGLTLATKQNAKFNYYQGGQSDIIRPDNNFTYNGNIRLVFSTTRESSRSMFNPVPGFTFSLIPEIVYKPNYKDWGPVTDSYTHDDNPGFLLNTFLEYSMKPFNESFIKVKLGYLGGINLYKTELWKIGQVASMRPGARLSGYQTSEYVSENAIILNIDGTLITLKDKFLTYFKHDMYYDINDQFLRQGSALGIAASLPHEIELTSEISFGWNAIRDNGIPWAFTFGFSKFLMQY